MKIFGFAGWSGSGKTTLIEKLVPLITARGFRVSLIKHAHHNFDVDQQGQDSWRHRQAGCTEVLGTSSRRWALMHELRGAEEPGLEDHVRRISPCDLVFVEGFKREPIPKIEVHRAEAKDALLHPHDPNIVAIATDRELDAPLPRFDLNRPEPIAEFILHHVGLV
ncbi:MAG: molybdopterin-guanine dinucleotide biosynthesis protein B [Burkholderiales bacterium]|nr:molybdopterin-guanine dinucleotide biosynthesis protein B [Burkholderiales bacterium]